MRKAHLEYLRCPECRGTLDIQQVDESVGHKIKEGTLRCNGCGGVYQIIRFIPRFVPIDNYAASFGFEWNRHPKTLLDSYTGLKITEERFFNETKWERNLQNETILEIGSGAGRYTEIALTTGAFIVSIDYSNAVEANYATHGDRENLLIVQGDIYNLPVRRDFFDKLLCIGVLQHTPDVRGAFLALPPCLKPGGRLTIDIYCKFDKWYKDLLMTKYYIRPVTTRLSPETLYKFCEKYVNFLYPITGMFHKLTGISSRKLSLIFSMADYRGIYNLSESVLKEWAVLDTFDFLSAAYDNPLNLEQVRALFKEADLDDVEIHYGYNGIEGRGKRKASPGH
ncbi:methyltransferase domain-containing protein [Candidatus Magnetomonas plexicatena]|uniref:methyltransferase domain-containing protein n=1 Tax=Candidatus Magnetomonas plexicatena TaxID=2552947 RepID=UPI001C76AFAF|nr:methyltransferase domain-containing protein [Nitrospirales bacterium LBB_01]